METLSPIAVFVYNRLLHTCRMFEALQNNELAGESELFIFSDGPRTHSDLTAVEKVREYVRTVSGFKRISVIERKKNLGLARSIITGVTDIVNQYDRIIVVEDDLVTSKYFLTYMNEALQRYRDEPRIMHIAGYTLPCQQIGPRQGSFFYRNTTCWGWGTWKRAWDLFDPDSRSLISNIERLGLTSDLDIEDSAEHTMMLKYQAKGYLDSWAIRWYASVLLNKGLCLHPSRSLVANIGNDASGMHSGTSTIYDVAVSPEPVLSFPDVVEESREAVEAAADFYRSLDRPFLQRLKWLIVVKLGLFKKRSQALFRKTYNMLLP